MDINKQNNSKEVELTVSLSWEELKPHLEKASAKISQDVKVSGFRPGKVPYDVLKKQVGEVNILQEAANIAVQQTADEVIKNNLKEEMNNIIGRPEVKLTKIAPDNPLEYKIIFQLMPEINLGRYKDLNIKEEKATAKDEDVERVIKDLRNMRAQEKITSDSIKDGYKVIVNIQMFLDNVPVEGGQSQNTTVIVGSDYVIPGFDKELLGAHKGETKEFKLPYPEKHYQKNLAGKIVEFKVTINEVYERDLPELNEEFAKQLGAKSVDDLREKIQDNIKKETEQKNEQKLMLNIFEKLLESTKFSHISNQLTHNEAHNMIHELKHNIEQQGGKFADYLTHIKKTEADLEKEFIPEATKRIKTSFIIDQIAKTENIAVTNEELNRAADEQLKVYAHDPSMKKQADTKEFRDYLHYNMLNKKVMDKLKEWNIKKD